jgi:hypothetical protein
MTGGLRHALYQKVAQLLGHLFELRLGQLAQIGRRIDAFQEGEGASRAHARWFFPTEIPGNR